MRRITQVLIVTATLLLALAAGWLVSVAGVGGAAAPAAEPTATPTQVHAYYLPLVAKLPVIAAGRSRSRGRSPPVAGRLRARGSTTPRSCRARPIW